MIHQKFNSWEWIMDSETVFWIMDSVSKLQTSPSLCPCSTLLLHQATNKEHTKKKNKLTNKQTTFTGPWTTMRLHAGLLRASLPVIDLLSKTLCWHSWALRQPEQENFVNFKPNEASNMHLRNVSDWIDNNWRDAHHKNKTSCLHKATSQPWN